MSKKVLITAGEASGDLHGANLVKAMRDAEPSISFRGVGSGYMREAGVQLLWDAAEMSVVGLSEVARHLGIILKVFRKVRATLRTWCPDLVILIDYPEFNLLVAAKAKKLGIPVMYYISPQIWAWRPGRIKTIRKRVDRMVVILPFEEVLYQESGVDASFVGHPLLDVVKVRDEKQLQRSHDARAGQRRLVGLLPGSRYSELRALLPLMLDAARIVAEQMPEVHFLVSCAPTVQRQQVDSYIKATDLPLTVIQRNTHDAIQMCEMVVAASGTVTLETAILGTPLVVVYKVHPLTYWFGKRLVRVKHVALVNLVAGEAVVPELLQHDATAERIAGEVLAIVNNPKRLAWMRERLSEVREKLGCPGASGRAAAIAIELMGGNGSEKKATTR
ncbi:MAG: lipid-A-disaccharide synthase [Syntrophobacteria bacterium]